VTTDYCEVTSLYATEHGCDAGEFCEERYDACELQPCGVIDGSCMSDVSVNDVNNRGYKCTSCDHGYQLTNDSKCAGLYSTTESLSWFYNKINT